MRKLSIAKAPRAARAMSGVRLDASALDEETTALRQLLLERRADLPVEREQARESHRARFAEALAALGELAIVSDEIEPLIGAACELLAETLDVDGVVLLQESKEAGRLLVRAAGGCVAAAAGQLIEAGEGTQAGFAMTSHGSTATADARAAWPTDRFLVDHELVAAALVMLPGFARPRVVLGAYQQRRRAFSPDEVRFLEAAAGSLSAAISRCRADAERKDLHAKLALADRMVSVGTLAAGVAHELNNPLAYVNANITFLFEQTALLESLLPASARADAEVRDTLQQLGEAARDARDGVERMRVIVRDLKMLSRADDSKIGPVEIGPILDSCINVAWNELKHRARLVKDVQQVPAVRGSEGRLGQIFLNLLVNAAQAMPEGRAAQNEIRISARLIEGDRVVIEVADTGCGIAPEILPRIFDPFFTTKPPGVGTGLGLSIVHGIVTGMGGEIRAESTPGQGSTFRVTLPVAGGEPADEPVVHPEGPRARSGPRARILVVDDEPMVGIVLQRTLGQEHDVVACGSVRQALERLAAGETYQVIFSDLLMPQQTGMDLHRALQATYPAMARRLVFLTGGACTEAARAFLAQPGVECLEKPFEVEAIRAVIARRLAADAAGVPAPAA